MLLKENFENKTIDYQEAFSGAKELASRLEKDNKKINRLFGGKLGGAIGETKKLLSTKTSNEAGLEHCISIINKIINTIGAFINKGYSSRLSLFDRERERPQSDNSAIPTRKEKRKSAG